MTLAQFSPKLTLTFHKIDWNTRVFPFSFFQNNCIYFIFLRIGWTFQVGMFFSSTYKILPWKLNKVLFEHFQTQFKFLLCNILLYFLISWNINFHFAKNAEKFSLN